MPLGPPPAPAVLDLLRGRPVTVLKRRHGVEAGKPSSVTIAIEELGFTVRQTDDTELQPRPEEIAVVWGNPVWFPRAMRSLERMRPADRPGTAIWFIEPLPPPRSSGLRAPALRPRELAKIALRDRRTTDTWSNSRVLARLAAHGIPDVLGVISGERTAYLAERGIESTLVPMGVDGSYGRDLASPRDIDVLFLGIMRVPGRRRIVRGLEGHGLRIQAAGDYADASLWGEGRTQLVNRAKIYLALSRFPGTFTTHRFLVGMACNALVVSDPLIDPAPWITGEHFVESALEDMPAVIERYLADDEERRRIARQGHEFVTRDLTMTACTARLLGPLAKARPPRY